jgi:hypothetical protein
VTVLALATLTRATANKSRVETRKRAFILADEVFTAAGAAV